MFQFSTFYYWPIIKWKKKCHTVRTVPKCTETKENPTPKCTYTGLFTLLAWYKHFSKICRVKLVNGTKPLLLVSCWGHASVDFQYCDMDADSSYMAMSRTTFASVVKPGMKEEYQRTLTGCCRDDVDTEWFPRTRCSKHAKYDKRTPGLFNVDMIGLCSKTYIVQKTKTVHTSSTRMAPFDSSDAPRSSRWNVSSIVRDLYVKSSSAQKASPNDVSRYRWPPFVTFSKPNESDSARWMDSEPATKAYSPTNRPETDSHISIVNAASWTMGSAPFPSI